MNNPTEQHPLIDVLERILPDVIWRRDWDRLHDHYGLPFKKSHMATMASRKQGPPVHHHGRFPFYLKSELLTWLKDRG